LGERVDNNGKDEVKAEYGDEDKKGNVEGRDADSDREVTSHGALELLNKSIGTYNAVFVYTTMYEVN